MARKKDVVEQPAEVEEPQTPIEEPVIVIQESAHQEMLRQLVDLFDDLKLSGAWDRARNFQPLTSRAFERQIELARGL